MYELIRDCVEKVNADLAADPNMSGSQIKRFLILHKELDADDGELTRTRKVKRGAIADKYKVLVDAMYEGRAEQCPAAGRATIAAGRGHARTLRDRQVR